MPRLSRKLLYSFTHIINLDRTALLEDIQKTARVRFAAARRLERHQKMSQWTITASSVVLIVIPLLQAFGVATKFSPQQLNVIQVILAVVVLVFGLLLSYEDFGVKAKAMHQCGVDLNNLHRISWLDASRAQINIAEDYHNILSRHDNHKTIDYQSFRLENRDEYFKERSYHWSWFKVWSKIIFGLLPYILTMVFLMYVMYFIFT